MGLRVSVRAPMMSRHFSLISSNTTAGVGLWRCEGLKPSQRFVSFSCRKQQSTFTSYIRHLWDTIALALTCKVMMNEKISRLNISNIAFICNGGWMLVGFGKENSPKIGDESENSSFLDNQERSPRFQAIWWVCILRGQPLSSLVSPRALSGNASGCGIGFGGSTSQTWKARGEESAVPDRNASSLERHSGCCSGSKHQRRDVERLATRIYEHKPNEWGTLFWRPSHQKWSANWQLNPEARGITSLCGERDQSEFPCLLQFGRDRLSSPKRSFWGSLAGH